MSFKDRPTVLSWLAYHILDGRGEEEAMSIAYPRGVTPAGSCIMLDAHGALVCAVAVTTSYAQINRKKKRMLLLLVLLESFFTLLLPIHSHLVANVSRHSVEANEENAYSTMIIDVKSW
jgi:hypothetical protein